MDKIRVADLTVDEFRDLIKEIVEQTMREIIEDPDEGLPLREDMEEALRRSLTAQRSGNVKMRPAKELADKLGLKW